VQQELVLAQKVYLMSGEYWINANILADLKQREYIALQEPALDRAIGPLKEHDVNGQGTYSLPYAVTHFADKLCENPRDHLYGLLGIIPEAERKQIEVDYNCDAVS
jgi:hypothetical protein